MVKKLYSLTEQNVAQLKWMSDMTELTASDLVRRMIEGSYSRLKKAFDAGEPSERIMGTVPMGIVPDVVLAGEDSP